MGLGSGLELFHQDVSGQMWGIEYTHMMRQPRSVSKMHMCIRDKPNMAKDSYLDPRRACLRICNHMHVYQTPRSEARRQTHNIRRAEDAHSPCGRGLNCSWIRCIVAGSPSPPLSLAKVRRVPLLASQRRNLNM